MDVLGAFLKECCHKVANGTTGTRDLYRTYQLWCEENGERFEGQRKFSAQLKERGFESRRSGSNGSYEWSGLALLNFWKAAICRKTEPSEQKVTINASKTRPRDVIGKKGSEGSENIAVEDVLKEFGKEDSGPQKTARTYLAGETKLEYVVRAVLFARGMDTEGWERHAPTVEEALGTWEGGAA